ncbi:unnamed protein product [Orchesella dallaii]|uniref:C2H2-type domain-containing protein n=1 Tax=Orchesella dallaii TaxID=48710 RepID=A0ABP1RHK9_9HEXA
MAELNSHLATSFTISFTEPPHYCSVCGWGFVNENRFKLHELVHTRKRAKGRYQCPTCSCSSFLNVTELQIHYNQKHGSNLAEPALKRARRGLKTKKNDGNQKEIATPPPCSMCGLQFLKWKYLDKHRKEAHNLGVECPTCFNVFGCRSSMTRHIKDQHNSEKGKDTLHPCPYCGIVCKSPSSLQTHIAFLHLNERGKLETHLNTHLGPERKGKVLKCPCDRCQEVFPSEPKLQRHLKLVHNYVAEDVKERHVCHVCGRVLFSYVKHIGDHAR